MFKDKIFHVRRDGGGWEAGLGRLRRPVILGSAEGEAFCRGSGVSPKFSSFLFCRRRQQVEKGWKESRYPMRGKGVDKRGDRRLRRPVGGSWHSKTRVT